MKLDHIINIVLIALLGYFVYDNILNRPSKEIPFSDITFTGVNGKSHSLEDFKGQPTLLNFWASWCAPCVREMPSMKKAKEVYSKKGIRFLFVNTEDVEDVKNFEAKNNLELPYYVLTGAQGFDIKKIPLTYLINANGNVVKVYNGSKNWASKRSFRQLDKLIVQ